MEAVYTQNPKALPWQALTEYYNVCVCSLTNPLATALLDRYEELSTTTDTAVGLFPLDPFPKQNWGSINDFPVVAIEGFKVIQNELLTVIRIKSHEKRGKK